MADPLKEASRGRSERTPFIALSGVALLLGAAAPMVILVAFLVYYLA